MSLVSSFCNECRLKRLVRLMVDKLPCVINQKDVQFDVLVGDVGRNLLEEEGII